MLKQAIEIFKQEYDNKGENMILDTYIPADGTYIIINFKDNDFEIAKTINIKYDRKLKDIDRFSVNKDDLDFICFADYNSKLIDMNKPIDSKKIIHSNNYMSFFIKKESLTNGKLTAEIIDNYYDTLKNASKKYKGKSLDIYKSIESEIGSVESELVEKIALWIKNNIFVCFKEIQGKDYLKIFFRFSKDDYTKEGKRYLIPNIYNNNDTNEIINEKIYGLPNNNMGLNAKKPYLENKSRKVSAPYLLSQEEALIQKKFFDYLMNKASAGQVNIYLGDKLEAYEYGEAPNKKFSGIYMRIAKGKEVEIHDYDIISQYTPDLIPEFEYKNILGVDYEKLKGVYHTYNTKKTLEELLNEVLFNKFLKSNYFTDSKDIRTNDETLLYNLVLCRGALFAWFYKGIDNSIWSMLDKVTFDIVKGSIEKGLVTKPLDQFNLRISLKEYFEGGESMSDVLLKIKDNLREKIAQKETKCLENDREYYFAVGQLASYFISRNRGKKKPLSLAKPFISAKSNEFIKTRLRALYNKYDYDIDYSYTRFKNLYSMVSGYIPNENVDSDMIIAGYLNSNLLYEKNENEENKEENYHE